MEQNLFPTHSETPENDPDKDLFKFYAKPLTGKLLEAMELSKNFSRGQGDYLYYQEKNKTYKVLDLTGGYGANILGHRHPKILSKLQDWIDKGAPSLTQGSNRVTSGKLAQKISQTLYQETSEGPWVTTFSNSGTEAIEAAYKHCLLSFKNKLTQKIQEIEKEMNLSLLKIQSTDSVFKTKIVQNLRKELSENISSFKMSDERKTYFLHMVAQTHEIEELVELVREINQKQISLKPAFIALEKSYHGKSMGALSLTANESFRNSFYLGEEHNKHTIFVSQYITSEDLNHLFENTKNDLIFLSETRNGICWVRESFSHIAGAFVEPIQGEAGIIEVSSNFLALLKKFSLQENFLLVFDEIQSGMYRTGHFAAGVASNVTADIYTFSKSLGGGVAKIAATSIIQRKYVEEFGHLHTSTFADDDLSSSIALEVLEIIQGNESPLTSGLQTADYLWVRLHTLKEEFPDIIKEIRGKGLMLALEFHDHLKDMGFEFKTICDSRMQGYLIASVLLNHEHIRMSPSLSNNLTLRIQPSLYFDIIQVEEFIRGLYKVCDAFLRKDITYFLSAIYPNEIISNTASPDLNIKEIGKRPLSVFLCHIIDETHLKSISKALNLVQSKRLLEKLSLSKNIAEFEIYHTQTLIDDSGQEMDIVMLGVPITSEELRKSFTSRDKFKIVSKVQRALDFAKELGAGTVGLGQFTSIVSGNGLYLNSRGMNLTTGNAYTVSLTVESALLSAKEKNIQIENCTTALIGAAGNIMSVATSLMADHVGKIITFHHTSISESPKYQESTRKILQEIFNSDSLSKVSLAIKKTWKNNKDLIAYLDLEEVKEVFEASSDLNLIQQADIVLSGASASTGFLSLEHFKQGSIIVDVAVPPSIKSELLLNIKTLRPDLTYHMGGVALLPRNQSIDFFVFPLNNNECFACMAETFSLGFSGTKKVLNIGDLSKEKVLSIQKIAKTAGFSLGGIKTQSSL